jgi:hypothetical protein
MVTWLQTLVLRFSGEVDGPLEAERPLLLGFCSYPLSNVLNRTKYFVNVAVRGSVDPRSIVRLKGLGQLKNPVNSSGIEPATFRLVD